MREITKSIYTFNELNPEAKQKAINDYIEGIDWSIESEYITEVFQDELSNLGYPNHDTPWSLNYSQGDGVAFYGQVDVENVARRLLNEDNYNFLMEMLDEIKLEFDIVKNSFGYHYSHYNTMSVEMELVEWSDRLDFDGGSDLEEVDRNLSQKVVVVANELWGAIRRDVVETSQRLEKIGYEMIEGVQSEESAIEYLKESDVEFYENGSRFVG
jgi:DNA-dependent RNA polymerase auxiliary subunit epsilon